MKEQCMTVGQEKIRIRKKKRQDTINFHIEEQGPKFFVTTTTGYKLKRKSHKVSKMQILCE